MADDLTAIFKKNFRKLFSPKKVGQVGQVGQRLLLQRFQMSYFLVKSRTAKKSRTDSRAGRQVPALALGGRGRRAWGRVIWVHPVKTSGSDHAAYLDTRPSALAGFFTGWHLRPPACPAAVNKMFHAIVSRVY